MLPGCSAEVKEYHIWNVVRGDLQFLEDSPCECFAKRSREYTTTLITFHALLPSVNLFVYV
jgi:hypothetical protein